MPRPSPKPAKPTHPVALNAFLLIEKFRLQALQPPELTASLDRIIAPPACRGAANI
jgi:hypothetical protein